MTRRRRGGCPDDSNGSKTNPVIARRLMFKWKLSSLSFFFLSTCIYLISSIIRHGGVEKCTHSPDSQS